MPADDRTHNITLRDRTYRVLLRIREDRSFATFDQIIEALIEKSYPHQYDLDFGL